MMITVPKTSVCLISTKFMLHLRQYFKTKERTYVQMWGSAVHCNEFTQWDFNLHILFYYHASPKALLA